MKILDKYLIKRFLTPFLATFLVVLFVLVILTIWQSLDKISGKGLSTMVILRYLGYTTLMVIPQALPIGILLSSIMAMGNLSENYEYAAIKSAGVSLFRLLKPLTIFMIVLSGLNFLFLNYVFPYASYESINLMINMKKKQPAMALVTGSFNTEIPGYTIKFSEKYGKKQNLLKDVIIYDLTEKKYNNVVITSKKGEIKTNPNSKYMTLVLNDGYYYKDVIARRRLSLKKDNMPFIKSHFDEYQINFDISGMNELDEDKNRDNLKQMLSLSQITEYVEKHKEPLKRNQTNLKKRFYNDIKAKKLIKDTIKLDKSGFDTLNILNNFSYQNKLKIFKRSSSAIDRAIQNLKNSKIQHKKNLLRIFKYQVEYQHRIAFSFACLVLFLIGAPLGSIIRKGGVGAPMITAVVIYVIFHFFGVLSRGMADTGGISPWLGAWLPTMIMLPFGIFLNFRALNDKGIFNSTSLITNISNFISKIRTKDN